ncbi:MAG: TonB-dependent receptor [Henriciella sp.]
MKSDLRNKLLIVASSFAVATSLSSMSLAQEADADAEASAENERQLDVVTVHGQRKEQTILEVPISASVFTDDLIDTANVQEADDYLLQTPNVTFSKSGRNGAREIVIAIRGVSDVRGGEKVNSISAFATYFDELGLAQLSSGQANPPTYDVESIEVLRGPQGVFFGRNSEGGAINIRTKKPEQDFYGRIDAGMGSFNTFELAGVVNGGITDTLSGRLTVQATTTDGPLENRHPTGGDTGNDYLAMRGQLRWQPSDATTVDLSINRITDNQDYTPKLATCINPTFGFNPFDPNVVGQIGCYDFRGEFSDRVNSGDITLPDGVSLSSISDNDDFIFQNTAEFTDNTASILTARVEHDFGDVTLVSVTGYSDSETDQLVDLDKSGLDSVDRAGAFETEAFSQEFRLGPSNPGRLDWTVGGFFYDESAQAENKIIIKDLIGPWLRTDYANENMILQERDGWAIFGNIEYDLTSELSVIAGLRYSEDNDDNEWSNVFAACPRIPLGDARAPGCELRPDQVLNVPVQVAGDGTVFTSGGRSSQTLGTAGENSSEDISPRLALNWQPNNDVSAYASIAKGYKPAGARANPDSGFSNVSVFDKETLWNYEIGGNVYLADRTVLVQGAVFYMDWQDLQVETRQSFCRVGTELIPIDEFTGTDCTITPVDNTFNADKATSKGAEFSVTARPTDQLTISAAAGYVDAKFEEFIANLRGTDQDLSGERLGQAPKWTASANAQYDFPFWGGEAFVRGEWSYRSKGAVGIVQAAGNTFPQEVPSFDVVNFRVGQEWDGIRVIASVENLFEEEYFTGVDGFSWGGTTLDYNPRRFSIRLTKEFGQ